MVTMMELSSLKDAIVLDYYVTDREPPTGYGFDEYVRTNLDARGDRDVALDLWRNPYELDHVSGSLYMLRSLGPTGYEDAGCDETPAAHYDGWEDAEYGDDFAGEFAEEHDEDPDDDICVRFQLNPHADELF